MSRDYVFTLWNKPEPDYDKLKYIIYGVEKCPTTDRTHYQGFAIFKRPHRIPGAKRILGGGDGSHLETRRGTRHEARDYCRKDEQWIEWGVLEPMTVKDILLNYSIKEIAAEYPELYCRYHNGLRKMKADKGLAWRDPRVIWIWGTSGCGKTRYVMEMESVFKLDYPYKWWDGYEDEDILLLDDFRDSTKIDIEYLLNLLDGYQMRLECKGSHTWAKWNRVYITSNYEPPYEAIRGLKRRIHEVIEM